MASSTIESMFDKAGQVRSVSKERFETREFHLRKQLLRAQFILQKSKSPVVIIVSGSDGAGKGQFVHRLNEWFDPRGVNTHTFWKSSDEEDARPYFWRFWRVYPPRGSIGILFGSWYTSPLIDRVYGKISKAQMDLSAERIAQFENMLVRDGTILIKLWFHLTKKIQRQKLEDLESDPRTHARVLPRDWKHLKLYDKFKKATERMMEQTHTVRAPWSLIQASCERHRELQAGYVILRAMQAGIRICKSEKSGIKKPVPSYSSSSPDVLKEVDLTKKISGKRYDDQLKDLQGELNALAWKANREGRAQVVVFEGWDAAGKGSGIRRVTKALDPRIYHVVSFAAPTVEERQQHYLWRFWKYIPSDGTTTIYDRSWYGRVLVERVEGFATKPEWTRAYPEIVEFEKQMTDHGMVVTKFWVHISPEEQMRRFNERKKNPIKRYKITDEDWRNRDKWPDYEAAVNDMVARTSTPNAPWTLIAGNDKKYARIQILKTLVYNLSRSL